MGKFFSGVVLGVLLGSAVGALATAVGMGQDRYWTGWTVSKNGEEICNNPYIWNGNQQIECN